MKFWPGKNIRQSEAVNSSKRSLRESAQEALEAQSNLSASVPAMKVATGPACAHESQDRAERRHQRRTRLSLPVRLSPAHDADGKFTNVLATLNSSRNSVYFTTASQKFYERMRLLVVFPYSGAHDAVPAPEKYGDVVRVDHLSNGRLGIALQVHEGLPAKQIFGPKSKHRAEERRITDRHVFFAEAVISDAHSGANLRARCSDLNVAGCYIDTINPLPAGSTVQLRLSAGQEHFDTVARVIFGQGSMGMGVAFCDPTADQELVVVGWLAGDVAQALENCEESAIPPADNLAEMKILSRLIRRLRFRGVLTDADVALLFSDEHTAEDERGFR